MQPSPSHQPEHFAEHTIIRHVAMGALSDVYEAVATHPAFSHRRVALKILRNRRLANLFMRIARLNAFLTHPRIPTLHMVGECEGRAYMVRQFVEGENLQNDIGSTDRSATEVARIVTHISEALDFVHGRDVIHWCVHPRHLLVDQEGSAWLMGFGEAALPPNSPIHLAPEQLEACGGVTPRTDVFALSETAFWLLSGSHPFRGFPRGELEMAKRQGRLWRGILELRKDLPREVDAVLRRGMAPKPGDRFASAGTFADALTAAFSRG